MNRQPLILNVDTDFPTDLKPFTTKPRVYTPPAAPKSNRQAAALEASLRRRARWAQQP